MENIKSILSGYKRENADTEKQNKIRYNLI